MNERVRFERMRNEVQDLLAEREQLLQQLEVLNSEIVSKFADISQVRCGRMTDRVRNGSVNNQVHRVLVAAGPYGVTYEEISAAFGGDEQRNIAGCLDRLVQREVATSVIIEHGKRRVTIIPETVNEIMTDAAE